MTQVITIWGYRPDGDARVFIKLASDPMPEGWSSDIGVIENEAHKDTLKLSERAGHSTHTPIPASQAPKLLIKHAAPADEEVEKIAYDDNQQLVVTKRKPIKV